MKTKNKMKAGEMIKVKLNRNDIVTVTLTEIGIKSLCKYYKCRCSEELAKYHHKVGNIYKFPLWKLMRIFGKDVEGTPYFEWSAITPEAER